MTGFEMTGERGFSLARERLPGMTLQCARRCQNEPRCAAFNLDYKGSECIGLTVVTESSRIDLRPTPGIAYFEGICLRGEFINVLRRQAQDRLFVGHVRPAGCILSQRLKINFLM